mmetsp:Transcript_112398/g.301778  ORF Transcript_112398/g.301778 Transcript_112398/m.301778 type:complete len:211 (+) Transcript_112398:240-872(+)
MYRLPAGLWGHVHQGRWQEDLRPRRPGPAGASERQCRLRPGPTTRLSWPGGGVQVICPLPALRPALTPRGLGAPSVRPTASSPRTGAEVAWARRACQCSVGAGRRRQGSRCWRRRPPGSCCMPAACPASQAACPCGGRRRGRRPRPLRRPGPAWPSSRRGRPRLRRAPSTGCSGQSVWWWWLSPSASSSASWSACSSWSWSWSSPSASWS